MDSILKDIEELISHLETLDCEDSQLDIIHLRGLRNRINRLINLQPEARSKSKDSAGDIDAELNIIKIRAKQYAGI